ncbi:permease [Sulfurospirillum sp. 1612]|uniref:permease n=1 Tax=Sulfurospirillum sp. 1612 TaxID=3094835 RepID=UPI002F95C747
MNIDTLSLFKESASFFIYNFLELTVLFIGVSFLVEVINVFINPTKVQTLLSSSKGGYIISAVLGSITPFCSCSTIPMTLGLLKAKASFGPIMTFLFTSPLLNPIIVAVFWSAFGLNVTIVYGLISFFASIFAGYTLEKFGFEKYIKTEIFEPEYKPTSCATATCHLNATSQKLQRVSNFRIFASTNECCDGPAATRKISNMHKIFNTALLGKTWRQFLSFSPYLAIGIGIGAFVHGFVPHDLLAKYAGADNPFAIPLSALVGIPLYIRAASMVGLAPALLAKGVGMGSILTLTVAGAGASLPEMIMLKKIFKAPIMIFFIASVFTMAIGCGFLVNLYF